MGEGKSSVAQITVFVASLVLSVIGIGLCIGGFLSPSWQVVDIREFRSEHHHGLWQDCTRPNRHLLSRQPAAHEETPALSCTYKFDYSASEIIGEHLRDIEHNSAAGESEHHQFFGWHKAVLVCIAVSLISAVLATCIGACASCSSAFAVVFVILLFVAALFSIIADSIFFFAAHRVDSRFVQGLVGTYEQEIGFAFYLHGTGTIFLLFAFIISIAATYQSLQSGRRDHSNLPLRELAPLYNTRMRDTAI